MERVTVTLALRWGADPELAGLAGRYHDMTKQLPYEQHLKLLKEYDILPGEHAHPDLIHALTASLVAGHRLGLPPEGCGAIRRHTLGGAGLTQLEKIVYLADKTEPFRAHPGVEELRELCFEDLDAAYALAETMKTAWLRSRGIV